MVKTAPLPPCRLSVAGILRHSWFRTELPPSLVSLNCDLLDLPTAVRSPPPSSSPSLAR